MAMATATVRSQSAEQTISPTKITQAAQSYGPIVELKSLITSSHVPNSLPVLQKRSINQQTQITRTPLLAMQRKPFIQSRKRNDASTLILEKRKTSSITTTSEPQAKQTRKNLQKMLLNLLKLTGFKNDKQNAEEMYHSLQKSSRENILIKLRKSISDLEQQIMTDNDLLNKTLSEFHLSVKKETLAQIEAQTLGSEDINARAAFIQLDVLKKQTEQLKKKNNEITDEILLSYFDTFEKTTTMTAYIDYIKTKELYSNATKNAITELQKQHEQELSSLISKMKSLNADHEQQVEANLNEQKSILAKIQTTNDETVESLQKELSAKNAIIDQMNESHIAAIADLQVQINNKTDSVEEISNIVKQLKVEDLNIILAQLSSENKKAAYVYLSQVNEDTLEKNKKHKEELSRKNDEIEKLKVAISQLDQEKRLQNEQQQLNNLPKYDVGLLNTKIGNLEGENKILKEQLQNFNDVKRTELESLRKQQQLHDTEMKSKQAIIESLTKQLEDDNVQNKQSKEREIQTLINDHDAAIQKEKLLQNQLQTDLDNARISAEAELSSANLKNNDLELKNEELKQQLLAVNRDLESAQDNATQIAIQEVDRQSKIDQLQNAQAKANEEKVADLSRQVADLSRQVADLTSINEIQATQTQRLTVAFRDERENLTKQLAEANTKMESTITTLRSELEASKKLNTELKKQTEATIQANDGTITTLRSELESVQKELDASKQINDESNKLKEATQKAYDDKITKLTSELDAYKQINDESNKLKEATQKAYDAKITKLTSELDASKQINDDSNRLKEATQKAYDDKITKLTSELDASNKLNTELKNQTKATKEANDDTIKNLRSELESVQKELKSVQNKLEINNASHKLTEATITANQATIDILRHKLKTSNASNSELNTILSDQSATITKLKLTVEELTQENKQLKAEVAKLTEDKKTALEEYHKNFMLQVGLTREQSVINEQLAEKNRLLTNESCKNVSKLAEATTQLDALKQNFQRESNETMDQVSRFVTALLTTPDASDLQNTNSYPILNDTHWKSKLDEIQSLILKKQSDIVKFENFKKWVDNFSVIYDLKDDLRPKFQELLQTPS